MSKRVVSNAVAASIALGLVAVIVGIALVNGTPPGVWSGISMPLRITVTAHPRSFSLKPLRTHVPPGRGSISRVRGLLLRTLNWEPVTADCDFFWE